MRIKCQQQARNTRHYDVIWSRCNGKWVENNAVGRRTHNFPFIHINLKDWQLMHDKTKKTAFYLDLWTPAPQQLLTQRKGWSLFSVISKRLYRAKWTEIWQIIYLKETLHAIGVVKLMCLAILLLTSLGRRFLSLTKTLLSKRQQQYYTASTKSRIYTQKPLCVTIYTLILEMAFF